MIQKNFNGVVSDLAESVYHAPFKDLPALGSTQIKAARKTLARFKAEVLDGSLTREPKAAFDLGKCVHAAIGEQKTSGFVRGPEVSSKAVKEWKEFDRATRAAGKIPLTPEEYNKVIEMFDAFFTHSTAHKIVSDSKIEHSVFWTDHETGLWCKARPDGIYQEGSSVFLWDYKTTISASGDDFQRAAFNYGYHISAAHYVAGYESATGQKVKAFYFIAQEKEAPYSVRVFKASSSMLIQGEKERRELLNKISVSMNENAFPAYGDEVADLDLPAWVYAKEENDVFGGVA